MTQSGHMTVWFPRLEGGPATGTSATYSGLWPVWFSLRNGTLKRSPNHSRKGARILAICRARGTQSSFPHIIIRTMCAGNCPPGGTNFRTAETVGSVKRSPSGSSSWRGSGCIGFPPNRPICTLAQGTLDSSRRNHAAKSAIGMFLRWGLA
jgi:hypothetical protein